MTPLSGVTVFVAGFLCGVAIWRLIRRNLTLHLSPSALGTALALGALLLLCVAFFFAARIVGTPEYQPGGELTPVVVAGIAHWIVFVLGFIPAIWLLGSWRGGEA